MSDQLEIALADARMRAQLDLGREGFGIDLAKDMTIRNFAVSILMVVLIVFATSSVSGQTSEGATPPVSSPPVAEGGDDAEEGEAQPEDQTPGITPPNSDRLRIKVSMMASYLHDPAIATLGFEKQGRVGFVIVELSGRVNDSFRYHVEINPVDETKPLPSCGEENFFYPNDPSNVPIGPSVQCEPDGRVRVDDYRFLALDPVQQQGPIRQAYVEYDAGGTFGGRFGRFILPIGLTWEETGAFTAKDTPHITRINTEANFGLGLSATRRDATGRRVARVDLAAFSGDGNKFRDYTYFYWQDGSLDSNSALTGLASGTFSPVKEVEVRGAYKFGYTGSKVERLPNFYASKRNDRAAVVSARYTPNEYVSVFGEYARYVWGVTRTSAELLRLNTDPVVKPGYFIGGSASYPLTDRIRAGVFVVREELSRDDALVKFLEEQGLYRSALGKNERAWIVRLFVDLTDAVSVGFFHNNYSNPLPQLSGIVPVAGERAFVEVRSQSKYGLAVRLRLQ